MMCERVEYNYISNSFFNLENYVRSQGYSGYDPYDALNSNYIKSINSKFIKLAATQIFVYSPINLRKFFRIKPEKDPKAAGIFLQAYCKLFRGDLIEKDRFECAYTELVNFLMQSCSNGYSGYCWGFNFDWQDLTRYSKRGLPTIVITSYVGNAFLDLFEITSDKKYLEIARSCCQFMLKGLNITKLKEGICFSYTPIDNHIVHNANLLGSALLARVYSITNERSLLDCAKQAFDFSISCQRDDGSWAYSINSTSGKERYQIDFHQGFIIDSLCDFIKYAKPTDKKYEDSLLEGAKFYMGNQFDKYGRSKWRLPKRYPIDMHHQAQGIISFNKLYEHFKEEEYLEYAKKIALWTIKNMQDKSGYFYYQKLLLFTNKIPYMRWGQAWMMLALATLLEKSRGEIK